MRQQPYEFGGTDRFRVIRQLGEGGTGVVYEAEDLQRGQRVALKTLKQHDLETLYRLKREFRALADLSHPNLVDLYDMVQEAETCFFTMELVSGRNIIQHCRDIDEDPDDYAASPSADTEPGRDFIARPRRNRGTLDVELLRAVLPQLASGLVTLHDAGLIHRDIKPSNVLIDESGRVVLLDFGLVADLQDSVGDSLAGHIVGTVEYMAPEQAGSGQLTEAADWYAVGVLIYEALTGRVPHSGSLMKILMGKQGYPPVPPRQVVSDVPEDLDQLCQDLLARHPKDRPTGAEILKRLGVDRAAQQGAFGAARSATQIVPFAGREEDLRQLQHCFEAVSAGQPVVAMVRGPSGIGKSALIRRFLDSLRVSSPDIVLLEGRCYESETVPYKAMDAVIDRLARHWSALPKVQAAALMPQHPSLLPRLFPMLGRVPAIAGAPRERTSADPQELRTLAFGALREVLQRLSERQRLVIFLDDLQWGDADSLALLADLLRPPEPPALLLLLCFRDDRTVPASLTGTGSVSILTAEQSELQSLWKAIGPPNLEIDLGPLSPPEAVGLARHLLRGAPPELAERVATEAGGIPFFIAELGLYLKSVGSKGMSSLRLEDVLRQRIDRLPARVREFLEVLAVAGEPVSQRVAASALEQSSEDLARIIRRLRSVDLVRAPGGGGTDLVECYHDRIRECVRLGLGARRRQELYRALAIALEQWSEGTAERHARYWRGAGDRRRASEYAREAATEAFEKLDFDRAARLYRMAFDLGEWDEASAREMHTALGEACDNAGRPGEAADAYLKASARAAPAEALELRHRAAAALLRGGYVEQGYKAVEGVLAETGLRFAKSHRRALASVLWRRAWLRVRGFGFRERAESDVARRVLTTVDVCGSVAESLGLIDTIRGAAFQTQYSLLALRCGEPGRVARAMAVEAGYLAGTGSPERARKIADESEKLATKVGDRSSTPLVAWARGMADLFGDSNWRTALGHFDEGIKYLRKNRQTGGFEMVTAEIYRCLAMLRLGEYAKLSERVPRQLGQAERRGDLYASTNLRLRFNIVWLVEDDAEAAKRELDTAIEDWRPGGPTFQLQHVWSLIAHCELALYRGKTEPAVALMERDWDKVHGSMLFRVPSVRVDLHQVRGRVLLGRAAELRGAAEAGGDTGEIATLTRGASDSARRLEREAAPAARAWARLLRAGAATVLGDREQGIALLRDGIAACDRLEMTAYAMCGRVALGRILGGMDGETMRAEAALWLQDQGVVDPDAMTRLHVPVYCDGQPDPDALVTS